MNNIIDYIKYIEPQNGSASLVKNIIYADIKGLTLEELLNEDNRRRRARGIGRFIDSIFVATGGEATTIEGGRVDGTEYRCTGSHLAFSRSTPVCDVARPT